MPVEKKELDKKYGGPVEDQVLFVLSDDKGYWFSEIHARVKCTANYLYIVLARLVDQGLVSYNSQQQPGGIGRKIYFIVNRQTHFEQTNSKDFSAEY